MQSTIISFPFDIDSFSCYRHLDRRYHLNISIQIHQFKTADNSQMVHVYPYHNHVPIINDINYQCDDVIIDKLTNVEGVIITIDFTSNGGKPMSYANMTKSDLLMSSSLSSLMTSALNHHTSQANHDSHIQTICKSIANIVATSCNPEYQKLCLQLIGIDQSQNGLFEREIQDKLVQIINESNK